MSEEGKEQMDEEKEETEEKIEIKAVLLGNSGVGKTNLINTCVGMNFEENTNTSTSGSFVQKSITIENKNYIINLWDTAGQERYKSITKIFLKKSELVIFVYDITDLQSFKDLEEWITMSKEMIDNDYICAIVGNKSDLYMREQVKEEEAKKFAESKGWQFQLVSAKKNSKAFSLLLKELLEEREGLSKSELKESLLLKNELKIKINKGGCC